MAIAADEMVDDFAVDQLASMSIEDIAVCVRHLDKEKWDLEEELRIIEFELKLNERKILENQKNIKRRKSLPHLVATIVEILEMKLEDEAEDDGAHIDFDSQWKGKCVVLKTSARKTIFLPYVGPVDPEILEPGDFVGVVQYSYWILYKLPSEYDSQVKDMKIIKKPMEDYTDIGGLDKQIQELVEAVVWPITHKDRFKKLGIHPPNGVLLYGPPGTGKTLMAHACVAQTNATFLKLAGTQLVQKFIGPRLVRDAFKLAKEKSPCVVFIDEIDVIGRKRCYSKFHGVNRVQQTMLELLNQLDRLGSDDQIKVIAATNRADTLDPVLMRSGRLDCKIKLPLPTEIARSRILQIHSRKMNVHPDVNFEELAHSTDDFNGAQLKAVCTEAGMLALRRDETEVIHQDFCEGILQVQAKKKISSNYYA